MFSVFKISLLDSYQYRWAFLSLLSRDLKLKYRNTAFGVAWSLLNPILQLTILSVIFSHVVRLKMEDYTLYLFSGLLPWTFFQTSQTAGVRAFLDNEGFIKKIYLPRMLFPLTKVCVRTVDFLFALVALILLGFLLKLPFPSTSLLILAAIPPIFFFCLGVAVMLAIFATFFRDIEYLTPILLQVLYFATPILYPITLLPKSYQFWMQFNPIYIQILPFQKLLYFGTFPTPVEWALSWSVALLFFVSGLILLNLYDDEIVFRL